MFKSRAILYIGEKIVLIERERSGKRFFVFPGGTSEEGESPEQTLVRELKEETGLDVKPIKLVCTYTDRLNQHFFLCEKTGGRLGSGTGEEMIHPKKSSGTYKAVAIDPFTVIHPVYPQEIWARVLRKDL